VDCVGWAERVRREFLGSAGVDDIPVGRMVETREESVRKDQTRLGNQDVSSIRWIIPLALAS
jgi:hypothetical protein